MHESDEKLFLESSGGERINHAGIRREITKQWELWICLEKGSWLIGVDSTPVINKTIPTCRRRSLTAFLRERDWSPEASSRPSSDCSMNLTYHLNHFALLSLTLPQEKKGKILQQQSLTPEGVRLRRDEILSYCLSLDKVYIFSNPPNRPSG